MKPSLISQSASLPSTQQDLLAWQRIILLIVLAYEGLGGLAGGLMLIAKPDGSMMDMPVDMMHGVFSDFTIPGIILLGLGVLSCIAFYIVLRRLPYAWFMATTAMGAYLIWFIVEIVVLGGVHWLHAMWGLPVIMGFWMAAKMVPRQQTAVTRTLLACGIIASLLYVALNIIIPMYWKEYNSASQTVSELSAISAPTRQLWVLASLPYTFLMIAFALGVLRIAEKRSLRIVGILLLVYSILGILWPFAPMHLRETLASGGGTISDTFHLALGGVTEILFLLSLGIAAWSFDKPFRIYSFITLGIILLFGALTFMDAPGISTNQPTPLIGVWERINIGVFLLWVIVLAVRLMKRENNRPGVENLPLQRIRKRETISV